MIKDWLTALIAMHHKNGGGGGGHFSLAFQSRFEKQLWHDSSLCFNFFIYLFILYILFGWIIRYMMLSFSSVQTNSCSTLAVKVTLLWLKQLFLLFFILKRWFSARPDFSPLSPLFNNVVKLIIYTSLSFVSTGSAGGAAESSSEGKERPAVQDGRGPGGPQRVDEETQGCHFPGLFHPSSRSSSLISLVFFPVKVPGKTKILEFLGLKVDYDAEASSFDLD